MERPQRPLEAYLETVDPAAQPLVRRLDAAIRRAGPTLDAAVKYRLLMYTIGGDWRRWVVAVDAHPKAAVALRFLYGVMLDDSRHVLRAGSSILMTWDLPRDAEIDEAAVEAYVAEAVRRYPEFRANEQAITETAKARASGGRSEA